MSYWSHNPELYDEIILRQMIVEGIVTEEEVAEMLPGDVVSAHMRWNPAMSGVARRAEQAYWGGRMDEAKERGNGK